MVGMVYHTVENALVHQNFVGFQQQLKLLNSRRKAGIENEAEI